MRWAVSQSGSCEEVDRTSQVDASSCSSRVRRLNGALTEAEKSVITGEVIAETTGLFIGGERGGAMGLPFAAAVASKGSSTKAKLSFAGAVLRRKSGLVFCGKRAGEAGLDGDLDLGATR